MNLLDAHHDHWSHVLYAYPGAGHLVGSLVPYEPYAQATIAASGPAYQADQEADGQLWPHLLGFLASLASSHANLEICRLICQVEDYAALREGAYLPCSPGPPSSAAATQRHDCTPVTGSESTATMAQ